MGYVKRFRLKMWIFFYLFGYIEATTGFWILFQLGWRLDIYNFSTIYDRLVNPSRQDKMTFLKLDLESASKIQKQKNYCFFKSYKFYLLQEVLNAIENLCGSLFIIYLIRIQ